MLIKFTAYRQTIKSLIDKYFMGMKEGRPYTVTIKPWYKPRTTGKKKDNDKGSQNTHINGHIQTICMKDDNSFDAVKMRMKVLAIDRGYPIETLPDGSVMPKSEADINTLEAGYLIDTIHQFADEWNIKLIEEDENV